MDLGKFDVKKNANKGVKYYFTSPEDGKTKLPIFMILLGKDSDVYTKLYRSKQVKLMNKKINGKSTDLSEDFFDETEVDDIDLLTNLVVGLGETENGKDSDYILVDDKKIKFTKENAEMLIVRFPFIKEQINTFVWNRANFLGN